METSMAKAMREAVEKMLRDQENLVRTITPPEKPVVTPFVPYLPKAQAPSRAAGNGV